MAFDKDINYVQRYQMFLNNDDVTNLFDPVALHLNLKWRANENSAQDMGKKLQTSHRSDLLLNGEKLF